MKKIRYLSVTLLTLLVSFIFVPVVFAHPLGNFTINQYAGLNISREMVTLDYIVDMAEIPAFQEIAALDANGNQMPDASEFAGYPADKCGSLQPSLRLVLNNRPLTLTLTSSSVEFPAGVGGLPTLRLTCAFQAPMELAQNESTFSFVNNAFAERIGWKEITIHAEQVQLTGEYSTTSPSNRLTSYPKDLLTNPLDQRKATLKIVPVASLAQNNSAATTSQSKSPLGDKNDAFTRLILMDDITLPTLLLALFVSFLWGAMHAMTPGHGKTIVGAYLVGSRGTMKHALYLGLTTTITHTLGVFAFGLITLFASHYIVPERLFPWITMLSGLFVVGIGLNLFFQRFKSSELAPQLDHLKMQHSTDLQPAFSTSFQKIHMEKFDYKHPHLYLAAPGHDHSHADHDHPHTHGHYHDHEHGHEHPHNHADHSHMPPEAITWRSLLALGVSGGLLPCPSALVVLLGAIALNRIGFGLVLVLAFSLGLAGALTAIGMAFIYAGKLFERFPARGKILGILPAFSALFISLIGLGIVYRALAEIGIV